MMMMMMMMMDSGRYHRLQISGQNSGAKKATVA